MVILLKALSLSLGDDFSDTKKSNKLWPHLIWAPAVKRSLGVSPPKGDIPGVTKHHYCLCFCRQTKIILENLKIEEEAKHS